MNEPEFKITEISTERKINGNSIISAMCIEDRIHVQITMTIIDANNKEEVKRRLILKYNEILESKRIEKVTLIVGEIL